MPNWKKLITSGSDASLNTLKLSGIVNANTDTDKFLVLDSAGNVDFRTGTQVRSDIGAGTGTGTVDTSGTPVDNDFAKFTDANTIEGRSYSEVKQDLSLDNVENTALSTWKGSTNITTLGTVVAGTWQGSAISTTYIQNTSGTNTGDEPDATTSTKGIVELATTAETTTGTDTTRVVTPNGLKNGFNGNTSIASVGTVTVGQWQATDIGLAHGGTGASLADPNDDRILFWDDTAGQVQWLDIGTNLSISGTTLNATGGGGSGYEWFDGTTYTSASVDVRVTGSLSVYMSGSTGDDVVMAIDGAQGRLFEVTDQLSGSLFSVNDISGIPIFEVFSDDTVNIGTFNNEAIVVTGDTCTASGSFTGIFKAEDGSAASPSITFDNDTDTGFYRGTTNTISITTNGTQRGTINNNGWRVNNGALGVDVAASATDGRIDAGNDIVAYSTSDKRLKENVTPIENALDKVSHIQGVKFDWKPLSDEEKKYIHGNEGHDVGVIAQEIEAVLPEVVTTRDNGYKAVKYEKIIPLLIESIKELKAEIEELKRRL